MNDRPRNLSLRLTLFRNLSKSLVLVVVTYLVGYPLLFQLLAYGWHMACIIPVVIARELNSVLMGFSRILFRTDMILWNRCGSHLCSFGNLLECIIIKSSLLLQYFPLFKFHWISFVAHLSYRIFETLKEIIIKIILSF